MKSLALFSVAVLAYFAVAATYLNYLSSYLVA